MLKKILLIISLGTAMAAQGTVLPGKKAPNFKLVAQDGKEVSLSQFKGKKVVLEWTNHGCPFVRKFYDAKEMQKLQAQAKKDGVVWLTINSSAKGKQGYLADASAAMQRMQTEGSKAQYLLMDANGNVGKKYGAKTTPHMFVINESGVLEYNGAIDSIPSAEQTDISKAKNYVTNALVAMNEKDKTVKPSKTDPYGCSVKY